MEFMKRFKHIYIAFVLVIISANYLIAQDKIDTVQSLTGIEIITSVDRAEIFIGDLIQYKVEIIYDSTYELIPPPLGANLGAFDVKDYQSDIISKLPDGREKSESIFTLSTFTTGDYVIPPVPVGFILPDGSQKFLLSEGAPIKVKSMLENADDSTDIKPLKAQYEFERDMTLYFIWGGAALLLILMAAYYFWRRMRSKEDDGIPVDTRQPWEIAFEKIALFKQKDFIEKKQFKLFYIELTEIAREYLGKMYHVNVLDMTTEEFFEKFEDITLPDNIYDRSREFLRHADLVKFAKMVPKLDRLDDDFKFTYELIELVRIDYEKRKAAEEAAAKMKAGSEKVTAGGIDG